MNLEEYSQSDGLALAALVRNGDVSPKDLLHLFTEAVEKVNPRINAIVEVYSDRLEGLDASAIPTGPFAGVPFLMKDVGALRPQALEYVHAITGLIGPRLRHEGDANPLLQRQRPHPRRRRHLLAGQQPAARRLIERREAGRAVGFHGLHALHRRTVSGGVPGQCVLYHRRRRRSALQGHLHRLWPQSG